MQTIRTQHGKGQNGYHFVFRPINRLKVFKHRFVREICEKAFEEVSKRHNIIIHNMKVMPDHVHLFVTLQPTMSISRAFMLIKGISSRIILKRCTIWRRILSQNRKKPCLWSPGKFYRSIGSVTDDVVDYYISNNKWYYESSQRTICSY